MRHFCYPPSVRWYAQLIASYFLPPYLLYIDFERTFIGAGQEVGKSCVVVTINDKKIMFDCGMHMGYSDNRRYPDFSLISKSGDFNNSLTCIVVTHFHLDHIGALPYFTEVCGYNGPIYMTVIFGSVYILCICFCSHSLF